ncbi:hypothetical protein FNF29_06125 [Cafeteria roenbergensis]|uniref:histidine kinase n=1 Tax=Cafeteria roenbergensis TaxID=33653 RepID=A0A5A8C8T0_CAFRO|nr:hypothetical protein FNF29_06125 [Cafeteria roenbergensis]|eukprot:KAA0149238.1 hypothetical protein FNF29_06125 [Cafeteria roenbergensis]
MPRLFQLLDDTWPSTIHSLDEDDAAGGSIKGKKGRCWSQPVDLSRADWFLIGTIASLALLYATAPLRFADSQYYSSRTQPTVAARAWLTAETDARYGMAQNASSPEGVAGEAALALNHTGVLGAMEAAAYSTVVAEVGIFAASLAGGCSVLLALMHAALAWGALAPAARGRIIVFAVAVGMLVIRGIFLNNVTRTLMRWPFALDNCILTSTNSHQLYVTSIVSYVFLCVCLLYKTVRGEVEKRKRAAAAQGLAAHGGMEVASQSEAALLQCPSETPDIDLRREASGQGPFPAPADGCDDSPQRPGGASDVLAPHTEGRDSTTGNAMPAEDSETTEQQAVPLLPPRHFYLPALAAFFVLDLLAVHPFLGEAWAVTVARWIGIVSFAFMLLGVFAAFATIRYEVDGPICPLLPHCCVNLMHMVVFPAAIILPNLLVHSPDVECPAWLATGGGGLEGSPVTGPPAGSVWPAGLNASSANDRAIVVGSLMFMLGQVAAASVLAVFVSGAVILDGQSELAARRRDAAADAADTLRRAIGYISHEARGPLNAAVLSLALLEDVDEEEQELAAAGHHISPTSPIGDDELSSERLLGDLATSINASKRHLDDLLLWERAGADGDVGGQARWVWTRPREGWLEAVERAFRSTCEAEGMAFDVKQLMFIAPDAGRVARLAVNAPEGLEVFVDADRILGVVTNAVSNCIKHTPGGGEGLVSVCCTVIVGRAASGLGLQSPAQSPPDVLSADDGDGDVVTFPPERGVLQIEVRDNGRGIAQRLLESGKLFQPFARLRQGDDSLRMASSGLGLAIVRSIVVEGMRGRVGLSSEEGEGTTFFARVPVGGGTSAVDDPRAASLGCADSEQGFGTGGGGAPLDVDRDRGRSLAGQASDLDPPLTVITTGGKPSPQTATRRSRGRSQGRSRHRAASGSPSGRAGLRTASEAASRMAPRRSTSRSSAATSKDKASRAARRAERQQERDERRRAVSEMARDADAGQAGGAASQGAEAAAEGEQSQRRLARRRLSQRLAASTRGRLAFVVDDERVNRTLLAALLRRWGFEATEFEHGGAVVDALRDIVEAQVAAESPPPEASASTGPPNRMLRKAASVGVAAGDVVAPSGLSAALGTSISSRTSPAGAAPVRLGLGARAKAAPKLPAMVTLDVEMPVLSGFGVLKKRQQMARDLAKRGYREIAVALLAMPVVVVSGNARQTDKDVLTSLGAKAVLTKPVEPEQLAKLVSRYSAQAPA